MDPPPKDPPDSRGSERRSQEPPSPAPNNVSSQQRRPEYWDDGPSPTPPRSGSRSQFYGQYQDLAEEGSGVVSQGSNRHGRQQQHQQHHGYSSHPHGQSPGDGYYQRTIDEGSQVSHGSNKFGRVQQHHQQQYSYGQNKSPQPYYNEPITSPDSNSWGTSESSRSFGRRRAAPNHPPPPLPVIAPPYKSNNNSNNNQEGGGYLEVQNAPLHESYYDRRNERRRPPLQKQVIHVVEEGSAISRLSSSILSGEVSRRERSSILSGERGELMHRSPRSHDVRPNNAARSSSNAFHSRRTSDFSDDDLGASAENLQDYDNSAFFDEDEYNAGGGRHERMSSGRRNGGGGGSVRSVSSNDSFRRRGRTRSDYSVDDDDGARDSFNAGRRNRRRSERDEQLPDDGSYSAGRRNRRRSDRDEQPPDDGSYGGHRRRSNRDEQPSDDASYGGLLDDESISAGRQGGEDMWNMNKSVFSTLHDRLGRTGRDRRRGGSVYDDDDVSTYSASSSYSFRQRPVSRSSSVASRMSQSSQGSQNQGSQNSSHHFPSTLKKYSRTTSREYDDDDSIGSLIGGVDHDQDGSVPSTVGTSAGGNGSISDASGSFLFDKKEKATSADPMERASSPTKEQWEADFGETLTHLEDMGLGLALTDDEGGDDVDGKATSERDVKDEAAWWIEELEGEGWFEHDTSAVYSSKIPPKRRRLGAANDIDEEDLADPQEPSGIVIENQPKNELDDGDDTSTVGVEDNNVEDWEERLWSLARTHYLDYSGTRGDADVESVSLLEKSKKDLDEQSVKDQEQIYTVEYEAEQQGVLEFRSLLLKCIEAYVDAFHNRKVKEKDTSSSGIIIPDPAEDKNWTDHPIDLRVYHYVPMSTARSLFVEVIKKVDSSEGADKVTATVDKRADVISSILVDDVLNIFRRYQVITLKASTKIGGDTKKSRKRVNKGPAKSFGGAQAELENYLYGEMLDEEAQGEQGTAPDILETKEHEIRIRSDVIKNVLSKKAKQNDDDLLWVNAVTCNIVSSNIRAITDTKTEEQQQDEQSQPMAQLYCLRYSPIFFLKALTLQQLGSNNGSHLLSGDDTSSNIGQRQVTYEDLNHLLFDESYLMKRFELQGPYDATITHLANWQNAFFFRSNLEKRRLDDNEEYRALHTAIVSALYSHLKTTLIHTGFKGSKDEKVEDANDPKDMPDGEEETDDEYITPHNYANIVATCLEIGRALHHLGVCLGRRQRDSAKNQNYSQGGEDEEKKEDIAVDSKEEGDVVPSNIVSLEITSYKNALEAYKAAIYVLSKAENSVVLSAVDNVKKDTGVHRQNIPNGESREASNSHRDTSATRDMPNDELQEIREAKVSVELHLADTLNCLGYCHDAKLSEYEKSLMAYQESLSLYIRHVGRFHQTVSNALHNMGAIHVELGQWKEAASCFRQCLSILKRKKEKEVANSSQESEQSQMFVTLQSLGNSLAEYGDFDASIACFQEIIDAVETSSEQNAPGAFAGEILSQMARVHFNQASKLSRAFNWQCHLLLFAESEGKKEEDPGLILARQVHIEQDGKKCIKKSIHSRRNLCYTAVMKEATHDGGIFSSLGKDGESLSQVSAHGEEVQVIPTSSYHVSAEAPSVELAALAKDLLLAGRLEFRSRSYKAALSYLWEAFLLSCLLMHRRGDSTSDTAAGGMNDLLVFNDDEFLKSEGALFQVPDEILRAISLVDITSSTTGIAETEHLQLLFLIGLSYTRTRDFDNAKAVMENAQAILSTGTHHEKIGTLEEATLQLDRANLHLRIGLVDKELGDTESSTSNYKSAVELFTPIANHAIFSRKVDLEDGNDKSPSLHESQRKEIKMIIKNGLASALHRLGQIYIERGRSDDKATKCLRDTAQILNEIADTRAEFSDWKTAPPLPSDSRCFWEDISAISTSIILSDANERSGRTNMDGDSDAFSLQCFEQAIGMREFIATTLGSLSPVDTESSLESFEDSPTKTMDCYSAILVLIEKRERRMGHKKSSEEEEDESHLTKEDVLFRIGNLQAKSGRFRDAINSYKEAEELTVARLGTKDHSIVMNILHNMGNAYRAISLSSSSRESRSAKEKAIQCYTESIRISQAFFGKQHVTSAESMQNLAVLYMKAGNAWLDILNAERKDDDDELAYKSFKESLLIRRKETGSQNELEMAFTLHNLGDLCLRKIGYYYRCDDAETLKLSDDAMNFLSESLKIRKVLLGEDDIIVGDTFQSVGIAHLNRALALKNDVNKMDSERGKAFKALTSALELRRSFSRTNDGSKPPNEYSDSILMEAHCLFYLGCVEESRSKYEGAKSHYIDALRLFQAEGKQRLSKMSPQPNEKSAVDSEEKLLIELEAINLWAARTLYHMANIHKFTGANEDAVSCYEEALRLRNQCKSTKKHGLNNALIHLDLAKVLHENQNYDKSIECYSFSLRTYLAHFGKDSLDVADTLISMGKSFAMKSIFDKTMQCYDKAMRVYEYRESSSLKEKKGLLHREIADTVRRLDGDIVECLEHYRSAVSFLEEFNERHRSAAVASDKSDQELNKQLLQYYSEMLAILRQVLSIERDSNVKVELCDEISDVLHRMGNLHATFGEYDEAMDCFTDVLETLRKANTDELRIADLLFNMGNIYLEQGLPEKSLDCLQESYDITSEALGEDSAELHSTLYLLGVALINSEEYESALKWLTQALSVLKSNEDENDVHESPRGKTLYKMGTVYEKIGDQAKAISSFQESSQILKVVQGNDLELSNGLNSLGNLLRNVSDFKQALDCYDQSLTIRTGLGDELLVANTKNNIGAVLSAMEDLDRAMAFSAEALRIKTELLGCDSIETARALVNMGQLYLDQQLYTNAEEYFERGLRTFRTRMEDDHPDIAMCVHKLGVIREALLDDEGALDYYLQSTHLFKSSSASEMNITMAFSLHNAALIYIRRKELGTALECIIEALDVKMAAVGASHSETAASEHWLGTIQLELEDYEAAMLHLKNALKVRVECFGTENLDVARTLFGLGQVHFAMDEFEEAIECLIENLRVLRKFGCGDDEVSKSMLLLGSSYQELGQFDTANEHLQEAQHVMVSAHGMKHLDVAQALFRLGICFCETNQYPESLAKFQECLEIRTELLGNLHLECANTYESIGIVFQKTERHEDAVDAFERALAIKKTSLNDDDEDFCVLFNFIGTSLFALKRFGDSVGYFLDSMERKKHRYGRTDEEYAMSVIDLAAAYAKTGDKNRSVECYREAIESGGLSSDSWELGVAHKCVAGYFFERRNYDVALESYTEAASIFEWWNMNNAQGSTAKTEDVIQCYVHLLELEDENAGPISEARSELCYKLANCYVQVNKHEDAVLMYREAIMIQAQLHGSDHLSVANTLHNLGNCYRDLCDFEKSAECLTKSLSLSTVNYEEENEEVADTCHCLAMTLMSTCELDEAATLFERALAIRKKKLGALDLGIASTLYNLAHILQMKGNWNNAMKHCKEALRIQRMTVGDDSPVTASSLECIGRIHMDKREFEDALQCFNISQGNKPKLQLECGVIHQFRGETFRAQEVLMKAGLYAAEQLGLSASEMDDELDLLNLTTKFEDRKEETIDKDLLSFAENVMFYGSVLMNLEKYVEALECFRCSNVIFQAKYGSDHLTLAENLHHTGFCLLHLSTDQHQLDEALELLLEALRIRKLHLVESHPHLEETLLCLGKVHHRVGNTGDALGFLIDAVKARDARLGRKHARMDDADALLQVGQLQQQSGQFRQALDSFEECLGIRRQILGRYHPSIGELLFYIGNLLREVGDLDLAQMRFEESLVIAEQVDPESNETADIFFSLGVLQTEMKHFHLALDAYLESLQIHRARGSASRTLAEILNNIGITYIGLKDFDRARSYHCEALESLRQELGDDHVDVAFCWHSLGVVYQELDDQAGALECFQNAVRIERSELYLQSLGLCLVQLEDNENAFVCLEEAIRMKTLDSENDADDDLAEIHRGLGIIWSRRKRFDEALKCFDEALKIKTASPVESEKDHIHLINTLDGALEATSEIYGAQDMKFARLLHQKGNFHAMRKEHSLAIEAYVETLRIYKGEHGDSHLSVANTLFNLGVSLNAKGSPDKAIRCFTKALRITRAKLGEDHLDIADTYEQVAESDKLLQRYGDAINYYERALDVRKQATGGNDLKSAVIMHELGKIHAQDETWDNAEKAFKECVRIRTIQLGQDDRLVAESMYNLGLVYKSRNDSSKALKYLEGSLRINKSKLAGADPHLADNFRSLGGVHKSLGNIDKSIFCYDKSMQIYQQHQQEQEQEAFESKNTVGNNFESLREEMSKMRENIALSLAGKGEALRSSEQFPEALLSFSECLDIRKSIDGPESAKDCGNVLLQMGDIYSQLGDNTNASSSFASALATYRQIYGTKHKTVADVLQRMSAHFVKVGEFERGYSCVKEALTLFQELLGPEDTKTGDSQFIMGTILFEWNDFAEASKFFERARSIHKQKLGETDLNVANSNFYLGCISERKGDYESAVQCLQDSLSGRREHLDEFDNDIADNLTRLGNVYFKRTEWDLAVTTYSDCLKIREASRGTDTASQIIVADALFDLGTALQKALDSQRSMQLFTDALKEYQRHLNDPNNVKIAKCHSYIGEIYEKTNELLKAVNSLEKATEIYKHHIGADPSEKEIRASKNIDAYSGQAETLFRLATAKDRLGEEATALRQYRSAMRLYKSLFGRDTLHVAKILNRLANMKGRAGSVDKAMVLFDESLRIRMLHLGNNHEDVAETLFGMGIVFEKRRDYGAAMKAYSDCLRIRSSKFGSDSMEVAQVVVNIGVVRGNKGDFSGALKSWNKALSIYRKHGLGDDDALVATVLGHQRLANQLKKRGKNKN